MRGSRIRANPPITSGASWDARQDNSVGQQEPRKRPQAAPRPRPASPLSFRHDRGAQVARGSLAAMTRSSQPAPNGRQLARSMGGIAMNVLVTGGTGTVGLGPGEGVRLDSEASAEAFHSSTS